MKDGNIQKNKVLYNSKDFPEWKTQVLLPIRILILLFITLIIISTFIFYITQNPVIIVIVIICSFSLSFLSFIPSIVVLDNKGLYINSIFGKRIGYFYPYDDMIKKIVVFDNKILIKIMRNKKYEEIMISKRYLPHIEYFIEILKSRKIVIYEGSSFNFIIEVIGVEIMIVAFWYSLLLVTKLASFHDVKEPIISPILISLLLSTLFLVYFLFRLFSNIKIKCIRNVKILFSISRLFYLFVFIYYPWVERVYFCRLENFIVIPFICIYAVVIGKLRKMSEKQARDRRLVREKKKRLNSMEVM